MAVVGAAERGAWMAPSASWVLVVGRDGAIRGFNAAAADMAGHSLGDVVHVEDVDPLMAALATPRATVVARLRGSELAVAWRAEPAGDQVVLLGRPLTAAQVGQELVRSRQELVQRLVTAVTHEANNSVSAISANVQYAEGNRHSKRPAVDPEIAAALRDARSACDEIEVVTKSLRLLAEGVTMDPSTLDSLVRGAVSLAAQPVRFQVRLQYEASNPPVPFSGDHQATMHGLVEILQWAAQLAESGTTMTAKVRGEDGSMWLRFVDGHEAAAPLPWVVRVLRERLRLRIERGPGTIRVGL